MSFKTPKVYNLTAMAAVWGGVEYQSPHMPRRIRIG